MFTQILALAQRSKIKEKLFQILIAGETNLSQTEVLDVLKETEHERELEQEIIKIYKEVDRFLIIHATETQRHQMSSSQLNISTSYNEDSK